MHKPCKRQRVSLGGSREDCTGEEAGAHVGSGTSPMPSEEPGHASNTVGAALWRACALAWFAAASCAGGGSWPEPDEEPLGPAPLMVARRLLLPLADGANFGCGSGAASPGAGAASAPPPSSSCRACTRWRLLKSQPSHAHLNMSISRLCCHAHKQAHTQVRAA